MLFHVHRGQKTAAGMPHLFGLPPEYKRLPPAQMRGRRLLCPGNREPEQLPVCKMQQHPAAAPHRGAVEIFAYAINYVLGKLLHAYGVCIFLFFLFHKFYTPFVFYRRPRRLQCICIITSELKERKKIFSVQRIILCRKGSVLWLICRNCLKT